MNQEVNNPEFYEFFILFGSAIVLLVFGALILGLAYTGIKLAIYKTKARHNGKDIKTIQEHKEEKYY